MKTVKVRDLMVPLSEYATVSEDASLYEAILALERAQIAYNKKPYPYRAVLVVNKSGQVIGKLSQMDILKALEPRYKELIDQISIARFGLSKHFIESMLEKFSLWQKPLSDICTKAVTIKVTDVMYTPWEGEYVEVDATLDKAVHQLIIGHHQSLLVIEGEKIVGILRLTDVFMYICQLIKECNIKST